MMAKTATFVGWTCDDVFKKISNIDYNTYLESLKSYVFDYDNAEWLGRNNESVAEWYVISILEDLAKEAGQIAQDYGASVVRDAADEEIANLSQTISDLGNELSDLQSQIEYLQDQLKEANNQEVA